MVGLMIKKVHDQTGKTLLRRNALHVGIAQHVRQIFLGQRRCPLPDYPIEYFSIAAQRINIGKQ